MAIDANGVNMGFNYRTHEDITAATLTTDSNDSGKVLNFTHAAPVVTLHAVAAGQIMTFRVGANPQVLTLSPAAADGIFGCDAAAVDNKDIVFTNQPIGSYVTLQGGRAEGWTITEVSGAFTVEA